MLKGVTLKGLEVFDALAATGSVAGASERTGLSQPAVSQQLRNLEKALGADLVDHKKRPMQMTAAGYSFLTRTRRVLGELRQAQSELTVMDLSHLSTLTLGIIDDFDNDLTPLLVTTLAESLTRCRFRLITAPSHAIAEDMAQGRLSLAVSASPGGISEGLREYPLIRDPFILITPRRNGGTAAPPTLAALKDLPFLRYDRSLMMARQIESHLARHKIEPAERFEISSNTTVMAMVAHAQGWAITTPLAFMRSVRFRDAIDAHPLPIAPFSRRISLFASTDWADTVPRDVAQTVRHIAQDQLIAPALERLPWLAGGFELLPEE